MQVAVAVELASYRAGLEGALRALGLEVVQVSPRDLPAWIQATRDPVVVLRVAGEDDLAFLRGLRILRPDLLVAVLCPEGSVASVARALRAGAASVVPWQAPAEEVAEAALAASRGLSLLRLEVAWRLAASFADGPEEVALTPDEVSWLRQLARGHRVAEVAKGAGYSERQMSRLLRALLARMGVADRTEALMLALRWGLVEGWEPRGTGS